MASGEHDHSHPHPHPHPHTHAPGEEHDHSHDPDVIMCCEDLVVGYQGKAVLPPINLQVSRGTFLAVIGRNGSGKSTWFKTLLGLQEPVSGRVYRTSAQIKSAYVPQTSGIDGLLPVRARELVHWGRLSGWSFLWPFASKQDRGLVDNALETAGASYIAQRPYRELSEGQKQRALLARVLATEADLVLLDEPTAAMDTVAERETMQRLADLAHTRNLAVVVVIHDLQEAAKCADQFLFVDRENMTAVQGDANTVFCHPAFRRQYGDEYCPTHTPSGHPRGPAAD